MGGIKLLRESIIVPVPRLQQDGQRLFDPEFDFSSARQINKDHGGLIEQVAGLSGLKRGVGCLYVGNPDVMFGHIISPAT
jgi:hypothetical protein